MPRHDGAVREEAMKMFLVRHGRRTATASSVVLGLVVIVTSPASALVAPPGSSLIQSFKESSSVLDVVMRRGAAVRRTTVVGPRGGTASHTVVRRGSVVRPGYAGGGVRWARPAHYRWPRGGAIAAGAAIGFVTAATAAAWAGAARPACAGTTPIHPARRASGTIANSA
jgi:hypothetical protein